MNKDQQLPHDLAHRLRLLDVLDRITQVSLAGENMEDVMRGVLDLVLEVLNADRAWFLYPCDPDAPSWGVPMERTRPGWPGLSALGGDIPTNRDAAEIFSELLRANGTIQYGPHTDHPIPQFVVEQFSVKSQLQIALRPKIGNSWVFGLHHCASEVIHDEEDLHLFTAVAQRISDSLSSLISIRQLRESEEKYRRIIETTQEGFGEIDLAGRIVSANKRIAEMFRYPPDEFIGLHIVEDLLFPMDRENMLEQMNRRRRGEAGVYELRCRSKDGEAVWVLVSGTPIKDESGAVRGSFAMMMDITERKQAETEREITLRKVERAQAMLQTVLDSSPDWIFAKDTNYRFLFVNRAFAASQGCTPQDMVGRPDNDFWSAELCNGDPARGIRGFHTDDDAAMAGELIHNPSDPATLSDGKLHIFDTLKLPLLDADGHCYGVLGYARDVTERKDAERLCFSEALLRQTQSVANIGSWWFNVPRNELVWSDETYRIFGIPVGTSLDYGHFLDYVHPDDRPLVDSAWQAALKGAPYCMQHRIIVDGETRWVEERAQLDFDAQGNLYSCTGSVQDITLSKAAAEEIQNLAFYDPLTRLPNRRLLLDRLKQALASSARSSLKGALLFIDLDNFKILNDTLGHDIGDLLLQQVAQRLEPCVREGDTVARLGGDEFVVILEDLGEQALEAAAQTEVIGEKILASLSQPYQLATHERRSTSSIGATLFNGNLQAIDDLMKQADIAMYQAKKAGRNTLRFFDPQMQTSITARVSLEGELRKALEKQQFQLYYQIQVDSSHRPLGAEALIRWLHPERGLVSPIQFIPLAEETGLILPIGQWVLETACAQIKAWQQDAPTRGLVLAVNVSARQFHQADFVAQVQATVQWHAISPRLLKLELTESMLLENIEDTIATMNALQEIGVQISLDDFGSGYSSLQYLKRLPLDQLKIDQSFIRDIATDSSDNAVVQAIIAMAQSLNLDVIAEGVETEEQRRLLLDKGCTHYQGYLFGKPVPIEQFRALLKQG